MQIYNGFTKKHMTSQFEIEGEILDYIERLENTLASKIKTSKLMQKKLQKLEEELKVAPKTAGRKDKFTSCQKKDIRDLRRQGASIKALADYYECSSTLIHKIVRDINVDLRQKERGVKITTLIKTKKET